MNVSSVCLASKRQCQDREQGDRCRRCYFAEDASSQPCYLTYTVCTEVNSMEVTVPYPLSLIYCFCASSKCDVKIFDSYQTLVFVSASTSLSFTSQFQNVSTKLQDFNAKSHDKSSEKSALVSMRFKNKNLNISMPKYKLKLHRVGYIKYMIYFT